MSPTTARPLGRQAFFGRLAAIVLATVLPLALMVAWQAWRQAEAAIARAETELRSDALHVAVMVQASLDKARRVLEHLARRPEMRQHDAVGCSRWLREMADIEPVFANIGLATPDGRPVCTSKAGPGAMPASVAARPWFRDALAHDGVVLSEPVLGDVVQRPTLGLVRALRGARGEVLGVLLVSLDLERAALAWTAHARSTGTQTQVLDAVGRSVITHPPPRANAPGRRARGRCRPWSRCPGRAGR